MKKFLEQLAKAKQEGYDDIPDNPDCERQYKVLKEKYASLLGKRALYVDKCEKEARVVTLKSVTSSCLILCYNHYGINYHGQTTISASYSAILCGDIKLEVEQ